MKLKKNWSPEFAGLRQSRYNMPPSDCLWNPMGFKNDYMDLRFSEMSAHAPLLEYFASRCNHVTEFGSRHAHSTIAFLAGAKEKLVSYDIAPTPSTIFLLDMKMKGLLPCDWEFKCQSTTDPNHQIEETEFLLVDTLHIAAQVHIELKLHANHVSKWIAFHDVASQSLASLDSPGNVGIMPAIHQFLEENKEWGKIYQCNFNHGLLILEKANYHNCMECGREYISDRMMY